MPKSRPTTPISRFVGVLILQNGEKSIDDLPSMQDQMRCANQALESLNAAVTAAERFWLTELAGRFVSSEGALGLEVFCVLKKSPGLDLRDVPGKQNISISEKFKNEVENWHKLLERTYKAKIINVSRLPDYATARTRHTADKVTKKAKPLLLSPTTADSSLFTLSTTIAKVKNGLQEFNLDGGESDKTYRSGIATEVRGLPKPADDGFTITLVDAPREFLRRKLFLAMSELDEATISSLAIRAHRRTLVTLTVHISVSGSSRRRLIGTVARLFDEDRNPEGSS